ncbi:MAG: IMP dehydrogenase [Candidatus Falkowbacteria bacterium]
MNATNKKTELLLLEERMALIKKASLEMYPNHPVKDIIFPKLVPRFTLDEVTLEDHYSEIDPSQVNLSTRIGAVDLNIPFISAAMEFSGESIAKVLFELGGCGIIHRDASEEDDSEQFNWVKSVLNHKPCLVTDPKSLKPDDKIKKVKSIKDEFGFDTIPIIDNERLVGILFTPNVDLEMTENLTKPVSNFLTPLRELKTVKINTPFSEIKHRLLTEPKCSSLAVVDENQKFHGIYFRKDCRWVNPIYYNNKPLVGIAISPKDEDLRKVDRALELGVGIIVIDSSHGNCKTVIEFAEKVVKKVKGPNGLIAVVAGNVASIDGYCRLAKVGVDAVKLGIGPGSICKTSDKSGVGKPMWSLISECAYIQRIIEDLGKYAPQLIPDGGLDTSGKVVKAIVAGGSLCMLGQVFASAQESHFAEEENAKKGDPTTYRGMGSIGARKKQKSNRHGYGKLSEEGTEGKIICLGPMKEWFPEFINSVQVGFGHIGAENIQQANLYSLFPHAWSFITASGQQQNSPSVKDASEK